MTASPVSYELRKHRLGGGNHVHYACPKCARDLHSPLEEAGQSDSCPDCAARFVVPGEAELSAQRQAEHAQNRVKQLEAAAKAKQAQQATVAAARQAESTRDITTMGLSAEVAGPSVRFSLGRETTAAEIDRVIEIFPPLMERLRSLAASV